MHSTIANSHQGEGTPKGQVGISRRPTAHPGIHWDEGVGSEDMLGPLRLHYCRLILAQARMAAS